MSGSSDTHNHYVFFLITQVGTGGGIFDDNTMIQEQVQDAHFVRHARYT